MGFNLGFKGLIEGCKETHARRHQHSGKPHFSVLQFTDPQLLNNL